MKDKLLGKLYRWVQHMKMLNVSEDPPFIPLTKEELEIIRDRHNYDIGARLGSWEQRSQVLGIDTRESAFAVCMRERMIQMPITTLQENISHPLRDALELRDWRDHATDRLYRSIIARVCTDTTRVLVRMEWDPFAKFKRALRITKWFPVRTRTVGIEGTVLYPYLNVTLPHNTHHVRFAVLPS